MSNQALIDALKQAEKALESCSPGDYSTGYVCPPSFNEHLVNKALDAIESALSAANAAPLLAAPKAKPDFSKFATLEEYQSAVRAAQGVTEDLAWKKFKEIYGEGVQRHPNSDWRGFRRGWQAYAALSLPNDAVAVRDNTLRSYVADLIHVSEFAIRMSPHISDADRKIADQRIIDIRRILSTSPQVKNKDGDSNE